MKELVTELQAVKMSDPDRQRFLNAVIEEAKRGEFHDYKNQKYDCGKVQLVGFLRYLHLDDIANRVIEGEFDEEADEEDIEMLRKTAPPSLWAILGLEPKH